MDEASFSSQEDNEHDEILDWAKVYPSIDLGLTSQCVKNSHFSLALKYKIFCRGIVMDPYR